MPLALVSLRREMLQQRGSRNEHVRNCIPRGYEPCNVFSSYDAREAETVEKYDENEEVDDDLSLLMFCQVR